MSSRVSIISSNCNQVLDKEEQNNKLCSSEPSHLSGQISDSPSIFVEKWLRCFSVLYRPDNIFACVIALQISYELEPHVVHNGCLTWRDMNSGLKYSKEDKWEAIKKF